MTQGVELLRMSILDDLKGTANGAGETESQNNITENSKH